MGTNIEKTKEKTEQKFIKSQIVISEKYKNRADILNVMLEEEKEYSFSEVDKIIEKGKITTDNQFYDINIMVDQLCQTEPVDNEKIEILNRLLSEYEQRKSTQTRKPTA